MSKKLFYLISFVLVLAVTGTASADHQWDITVGDAGFDDYTLSPHSYIDIADPCYYNTVPDPWECLYGEAWIGYDNYWDDPEGPDLPALSGHNIAYGYDDYIYQILDETFIEGGTYTLSVWVGLAWSGYSSAWSLYFTAEDYANNLIQTSGSAPIGSWGQVSLAYTATAADAGKKVGIKIFGATYVSYEDVTLSYDGPPGSSMATKPDPNDGDEYYDDSVDLSWKAAVTAVEHDVYFGTNFDDVNDANENDPMGPDEIYKGRQTDASYEVSVDANTTYYWRIDEVNDADANSPWKGNVWSFWTAPWEPQNPNPPDGETGVSPNADLSWSAGFGAKVHEVFFGTDPCSLPQIYKSGPTTCDPGTLLKGTTYYWRVKEWQQPQGRKTLGPIWSFSTLPVVPITDPNLIGWWTFDEGEGTYALDWSGHDNDGTLNGDPQWVTDGMIDGAMDLDGSGDFVETGKSPTALGLAGNNPKTVLGWVFIRGFNNGGLWSMGSRTNGQQFCLRTLGGNNNFRVQYWGGAFDIDFSYPALNEWVHFGHVHDGITTTIYANGEPVASEARTINTVGNTWQIGRYGPDGATLIGIIDDVRLYDYALSQAEVIRAMTPPEAWDPRPADGAPEAPRPITLRWKAGAYAAQHDVYFGTSEVSMTLQDTLPLGTEEYDPPGTLDPGQTYYWKVNEVNMAEEPNTWEGHLWSFTTVDHLVVDDMESYTDRLSIATIWRDGYECVDWGDPPQVPPVTGGCSGSVVDVASGVGGGTKAMVFNYDNDGNTIVPGYPEWPYPAPYYSEIKANTLNLPIGSKDWSEFKALSLWFYGDPANTATATEQMYVVLEDGTGSDGVVYYDGDMNDIKIEEWQEWNIALQDFNDQGVDLADVNNISIGFGDRDNHPQPGGSGVVYFDDISLYLSRCLLSLRSDDFARVDFVDDCVVDYKELKVMAENWLGAVPIMVPIPIDNPGFEDPVLADGAYGYSLDNQGWGYFDNAGEQGSWNPGLPGTGEYGYGGNAPEGQNVGWANAGGVGVPGGFAQVLTNPDATLTADTTYKLTVEVGNTLGFPWHGYKVQLLAGGTPHTPGTGAATGPVTGGTLLAEDNNSLTIAEDTFETSTVTYTYNPAHSGLLGEPLQIRLLSLGNVIAGDYTEADFDNLTLYRSVDLYEDMETNFKDFAVLADMWLDDQLCP